jgi:hypothetical protein
MIILSEKVRTIVTNFCEKGYCLFVDLFLFVITGPNVVIYRSR